MNYRRVIVQPAEFDVEEIYSKLTLADLDIVFSNFARSRRYRNVNKHQFGLLMRHAPGKPQP